MCSKAIGADMSARDEKMDVEKTVSFLLKDVVWAVSEDTFRGKNEARHDITWNAQSNCNIKFRDAGIGAHGNLLSLYPANSETRVDLT